MKYELRELCSADIFPITKILSKIGMTKIKEVFDSDSMNKILSKGNEGFDAEAFGITIALGVGEIVLANISDCENEIYKFLSGVTGEKIDELRKCSISDFAELIIALVKKDEFKDFFGVVSKLFS